MDQFVLIFYAVLQLQSVLPKKTEDGTKARKRGSCTNIEEEGVHNQESQCDKVNVHSKNSPKSSEIFFC